MLEKFYSIALDLEKANLNQKLERFSREMFGINYSTETADPPLTSLPSCVSPEIYLHDLSKKSDFLYSFKTMDCVTYIETVLALSLIVAEDLGSFDLYRNKFEHFLKKIRYKEGKDLFFNKNYYFFCIDWITNNRWLVEENTKNLGFEIRQAKTMIEKKRWLHSRLIKCFSDMKLESFNQLLSKYPIPGSAEILSLVNYIPLHVVINQYENFLQRIPDCTLIVVVRPAWDVKHLVGTRLNISHVGFCFKIMDRLFFRHATKVDTKQVVEIELIDYLTKFVNNPTVKGLMVLNINVT